MNGVVSLLVVLISFALIIYLTFKGYGNIIAPLICVCIVSLVAENGFSVSLFQTFPSGVANFIQRIMMPIISGTIFGQLMLYCKAGDSIGRTFVKLLGKNNAPYVILLTSILVTLSGMSMSVFVIAALSHALLKECDLPISIGLVCCFGAADITSYCMPGVPNSYNVLASSYFGTNIYAGTIPGLAGAIAGYIFIIIIIKLMISNARKNNIGYSKEYYSAQTVIEEDSKVPPFFIAIFPLLEVIIVSFILQNYLSLSANLSVFTSQAIAIITMIITCGKYLKIPLNSVISESAEKIASALIVAGCLCGYAAVVTSTSAFKTIEGYLNGININPYVFTILVVAIISGLSADSSTGVIMFFQGFSERMIQSGAKVDYIHRLSLVTATAFDSMPHSAIVILTLKIFGLDYKKGYKYVFLSGVLPSLVATLVALLASIITG